MEGGDIFLVFSMRIFSLHFLCRLLFPLMLCLPAVAESNFQAPAINRLLAAEAIESLASGIRYRYGGTDPASGLDCSAFIGHLFRAAVGGTLPRTTTEIREVGAHVSRNDIKPGDLVFFSNDKRHVSHVGVYIGGAKFVHASRKHGVIRKSGLNEPYWQHRFHGVRRLAGVKPTS